MNDKKINDWFRAIADREQQLDEFLMGGFGYASQAHIPRHHGPVVTEAEDGGFYIYGRKMPHPGAE